MILIRESLFGASKIPYDEITSLERNSPQLIVYAIPVLAFFTFLEIAYSRYLKNKSYKLKESIGSALVGFGNLGINLLFKVILLYCAVWIYNLVPWRIAF
ncbi:MAG TPA: hypothetical protein PLT16_06435, partial [Daejeonella sp.]|nr:hypothetical protein [Daejeonella sp.]